jgi:hypothetical protein
MRRNYWVVVANVLVLAVLVGCRETVVAPSVVPSGAPVSAMLAPAGGPSLSLSGGNADNEATDFTVGPTGGVFYIGNHAVSFPALSICDPATAQYGEVAWDAPCKPATKPLRIHAEVRVQGGHTWVDFSPQLRFVPSSNAARSVWMYMYTPQAKGAKGDLARFNILYAHAIGGTTVNDAATDPALRTYVDTRSGTAYRRIEHFSGYAVNAGRLEPE